MFPRTRSGSGFATALLAVLLAVVATVGTAAAATATSCAPVCSAPQSSASTGAADEPPADGWEAPCLMDPGCGGTHAQGHGATGLAEAAHGRLRAPHPSTSATGVTVPVDPLSGRLGLATDSPPPRHGSPVTR